MGGTAGVGCISDSDPQPLLVRSHLGMFAVANVGLINNAEKIVAEIFEKPGHYFMAMSSGKINDAELIAMLVNRFDNLVEGIKYVQEVVEGSVTILLLTPDGLIAARDKLGRLPVLVGSNENGCCVAMESFACQKLGYTPCYNLGPGEIVRVTENGVEQLAAPGDKMKICAFLWSYYGYPNSNYEGLNVEVMRCRNGEIMARDEAANGTLPDVDYVAGVPDSGVPHAIGYANRSHKTFARPFVKYTPTWARSFTPSNQEMRNLVAEMKQIPVPEFIEGKKLLLVDDSIVRGTQLRETVDFLYQSGAKEVHMRSACPPIMYGCKYLNFSRSKSDLELIARKKIQELEGSEGQNHIAEYADGSTERGKCLLKSICDEMGFDSLGYQSLSGLLESIGLDREKICTYCWTGEE
jgi:amidophosphoribosyltransferase